MPERLEKNFFNSELASALGKWHKIPGPEQSAKLASLMHDVGSDVVEIKIDKKVLDRLGDDAAITRSAFRRYGREEFDVLAFETSSDVKLRMGMIKGEPFLMLDSKFEPTFAFFRPDDVLAIAIK